MTRFFEENDVVRFNYLGKKNVTGYVWCEHFTRTGLKYCIKIFGRRRLELASPEYLTKVAKLKEFKKN